MSDNSCAFCGSNFEMTRSNRKYCCDICSISAFLKKIRDAKPAFYTETRTKKCLICGGHFETNRPDQLYCSIKCRRRMGSICKYTKVIQKKSADGTYSLEGVLRNKGKYTQAEILALRADPFCVLPNRTLLGQWIKCKKAGIPRDRSLLVEHGRSPEGIAKRKARKQTPEQNRRQVFRRRVRSDPHTLLQDLKKLAKGHRNAEDIVDEGFATVLRLAIPAAEAFKLAKAEVNRTSAQPFREQLFNPDIDYEARETGRQVARASDIRAARDEA